MNQQLLTMCADAARGALVHFAESNATQDFGDAPWVAYINCDKNERCAFNYVPNHVGRLLTRDPRFSDASSEWSSPASPILIERLSCGLLSD